MACYRKRKKNSQYIKRGVPWILVCHPQSMKIYKCSTGINCNYIYKRCHHLPNMGVFNLQHIFNHILQSNLEQEHLSQKTKKESSLKGIYGAWWCSVMIGTIIFPPFGRLKGKSLCNYTKNMPHNMCTSSGVTFHCYHSASAMHSHYNIKTKEYYKNNTLNKSQHYYLFFLLYCSTQFSPSQHQFQLIFSYIWFTDTKKYIYNKC